MGGELKQYQVLTSPARLAHHDVTLDELTRAVKKSNIVTGGGFLLSKTQESLITIVGRATSLDDVAEHGGSHGDPCRSRSGRWPTSVTAGRCAAETASVNAEPAGRRFRSRSSPVPIRSYLDRRIEKTLNDMQPRFPPTW